MVTVHVKPEDLTKFWIDRADDLMTNYLLLAEDVENDYQVYITDESKSTVISVWHSGSITYSYHVDLSHGVSNKVLDAMVEYYEQAISLLRDDDEVSDEVEMLNRQTQLETALTDFLDVLTEGQTDTILEMDTAESLLLSIEEFLYEVYGVPCWHPIMNDDGEIDDYPACPDMPDEESDAETESENPDKS